MTDCFISIMALLIPLFINYCLPILCFGVVVTIPCLIRRIIGYV